MARTGHALRKATLQAVALSAISSIVAQLIAAYRSSHKPLAEGFNPLGLEWKPVAQFTSLALVTTPLNFLWQQYLEGAFPGYPPQREKQKIKVDDDDNKVPVPGQSVSVKNTAIKFFLDQTIAAWVNTALFVAGITLIRGGGLDDAKVALSMDFWELQWAAYKLWPIVSLLNFVVVPAERRVVVAAVVGLFWNVYMVLRVS